MKFKQLRWIFVFVLLLSMSSLACSLLGGGDEEATAVPVTENEAAPVEAEAETAGQPAPTSPPAATEAPAAVEEETAASDTEPASDTETVPQALEVNSLAGEPDFAAYLMTMDIAITSPDESGEDVTQTVTAEILRTTDPNATRMNMQFEGMDGADEFGETTFIQTEEASYMMIPGMGCISAGEGETAENPFADLTDTSTFLEEVGNADYVGEEIINGVETLHYTFDQAAFMQEDADIEWAEGHVYIAKDGGYMVRFVMDGKGALGMAIAGEDQPGTMHLELNIEPIDEPVTIEIPAECEGGAAESEYPVLEDAAQFTMFGGIVSYVTQTPFADILSFYDRELSAEGWVKDEAGSFVVENSSAIVSYMKDGQTLNITIGTDDDGQTFSIVIFGDE
ncbi:MAG TPA: hypothetical protein EYH05_15985 [Anaerolineae bacterium]|nr:hypothetical protein [Anaerolineae bacterium]